MFQDEYGYLRIFNVNFLFFYVYIFIYFLSYLETTGRSIH